MARLCELHRLGTLVYLDRASGNVSRDSPRVFSWTRKAFDLLSELGTCRWLFPLLVVGCEARSDNRRTIILNLISKTEETHLRNLDCIRSILEAIWVQDDLADGDLVYIDKLRAILSSSQCLPVFV